jgi:RNA polymerase sigma-70 factor (ECF subfamily)
VAYRLTGTRSDAEDAVQESWFRIAGLSDAKRTEIRDVKAWLTTVVGRICLDHLQSASVQREQYIGHWLPEPILTPIGTPAGEDPLEAAVRDDGVRMAAMVVLDKLTPEQRVAFVLHDALSAGAPERAPCPCRRTRVTGSCGAESQRQPSPSLGNPGRVEPVHATEPGIARLLTGP